MLLGFSLTAVDRTALRHIPEDTSLHCLHPGELKPTYEVSHYVTLLVSFLGRNILLTALFTNIVLPYDARTNLLLYETAYKFIVFALNALLRVK
jgi:hypothetical protein